MISMMSAILTMPSVGILVSLLAQKRDDLEDMRVVDLCGFLSLFLLICTQMCCFFNRFLIVDCTTYQQVKALYPLLKIPVYLFISGVISLIVTLGFRVYQEKN